MCTSQYGHIEGMTKKSHMPRTPLNFIRGLRAIIVRLSMTFKLQIDSVSPAECKILHVKVVTRIVMDRMGTPAKWWLLCMSYVVLCDELYRFSILGFHFFRPLELRVISARYFYISGGILCIIIMLV